MRYSSIFIYILACSLAFPGIEAYAGKSKNRKTDNYSVGSKSVPVERKNRKDEEKTPPKIEAIQDIQEIQNIKEEAQDAISQASLPTSKCESNEDVLTGPEKEIQLVSLKRKYCSYQKDYK